MSLSPLPLPADADASDLSKSWTSLSGEWISVEIDPRKYTPPRNVNYGFLFGPLGVQHGEPFAFACAKLNEMELRSKFMVMYFEMNVESQRYEVTSTQLVSYSTEAPLMVPPAAQVKTFVNVQPGSEVERVFIEHAYWRHNIPFNLAVDWELSSSKKSTSPSMTTKLIHIANAVLSNRVMPRYGMMHPTVAFEQNLERLLYAFAPVDGIYLAGPYYCHISSNASQSVRRKLCLCSK